MKNWEDLVLETAERFGGTFPHPETSQAIATVHQRAPNSVERAIDEVATDYAAGSINSPWGILRSRVQKITADVHTKATSSNQREKAIARAEQRIRNELLHYDRLEEVLDELFGHRGTLREHDTPELRDRMSSLWHEHRPLGTATELEAEARGLRYQQQPKITTEPRTRTLEDLKTIAARKGADTTPLV